MVQFITVGQVYEKKEKPLLRAHGKHHFLESYDKVLSVTLTHVYIQNMRTRYTRNIDIEWFNREWALVESQEKHSL